MSNQGNDLVFTGERFIPGMEDYKLEMEHIQRYRMAALLTQDKFVLDAACGEGYGSAMLAENATAVLGVDISWEAVSHASYRYSNRDNLHFERKDIADLSGIKNSSVDVVVSFETIEHISENTQQRFLKEIKRVLRPDGLLIMSTPNKKIYSELFDYHNEYHLHEFTQQSFTVFLQSAFRNIRMLGQSFEVNCIISDALDEREATTFVQGSKDPLETCKFFIAIASDGVLPAQNLKSVFLGNYGEYNERIFRLLTLQEEEEGRNRHIEKLNGELEEKGSYIRSLQKEISDKDAQWRVRVDESHASLRLLSKQFTERTQILQEMADRYQWEREEAVHRADEAEIARLQAEQTTKDAKEEEQRFRELLSERSVETEQCQAENQKLYESLEKERQQCEEQKKCIDELKGTCTQLELAREQQEQRYVELKESQERLQGTLVSQEQALMQLKATLTQREQKRIELEQILTQLGQEKEQIEKDYAQAVSEWKQERQAYALEFERCKNAYEELSDQKVRECGELKKREQELREKLTAISATYEDRQKELRQLLKNREGHIEQLIQKEREFNRIRATRSYRVGQKLHEISNVLLPGGSTRRFVLGTLLKIICHPVKMMHFLNPHRIRKFFWLLRMGGMDAVKYRFQVLEANELTESFAEITACQYEITELDESRSGVDGYDTLTFECYAMPEVSIVIPVYNQFAYTYECLKSIIKNTTGVAYEVILADDNSTDLTVDIARVVQNITVVKNQGERGFLPNCNYAAALVKGKYILFLNNDTQVQENWLKPMVELLERDETIGMTGAKLVYADGTLQEAGGILWRDGSAWNFGHRRSPGDPEYNYVREVDYISGAAIMIRKNLWQAIGGFDEQYSPAYYEDTDLAFEVRKHGFRVVYQPASVVVHFEGISNGTSVSSGMKAYQAINEQKFYRKWREVLERDHFANGQEVFLAKDRSRYKKQILVIDHYVPHFDNDAGGRCTFMWLKLFVRLGMKVTFIGDNFYRHEPYTSILNQLGIEVLYGNFYYNNHKEWLKENLHYFDYIYLQRPHISIKYIDLVKQYGRGKIFYFAHDLHFLRLGREYELTHNEQIRRQAEDIKKTEMYLFEKADVVHVVGSYEQELLSSELSNKIVRNIPLYIYEDVPRDINKDFAGRQDLIFVGGFGHPPNVDAVKWFAKEIFPTIQKKLPGIVWHIVGGKVPEEIKEMSRESIVVHGFVSDEDLEQLYRKCRLAVVPLRIGAGVKGKVLEAAYYQIPLVTTTIGGEGIPHEFHAFAIEDDAEKMAELIVGLYQDCGKLEAMSNDGIKLIEKYYTLESAERIFVQDL